MSFRQRAVVRFTDGTETEVVLSQWSLGQFGQWSSRQNLKMDLGGPGAMGVVMLRYQAYAELHRDSAGPVPGFDKWDRTVDEVDTLEDAEPVDPTRPGTPGG